MIEDVQKEIDNEVISCLEILNKIPKYEKQALETNEFSNIILTDEMMNNIQDDYLEYTHIDQNALNELIASNKLMDIPHGQLILPSVVTKVKIDWDKLALNSTFTYDMLCIHRKNISLDVVIKSPAFNKFNESNYTIIDSLFSWADLCILSAMDKLIDINLHEKCFIEYGDQLYHIYIKERAFRGYALSEYQENMFKDKLIIDSLPILNGPLVKVTDKFLLNISPKLFKAIITCVDNHRQFFVVQYYLTKKLLVDDLLELYIEHHTDIKFAFKNISEYQVPSIEFVRKYRASINGISILKTMIKKGRVKYLYVSEFKNDILAYDQFRSSINLQDTLKTGDVFNNKPDATLEQLVEYKQDVMMDLYELVDNDEFKKTYEDLRNINKKDINEPIPSEVIDNVVNSDSKVTSSQLNGIIASLEETLHKLKNISK